jgi:hypothetical protein
MNLSVKPDEVYTFKLTSGEELVGKVTAVDHEWITVTNPVSIAPGPQGSRILLGLVPAMLTADTESVTQINISNVTMYAATDGSVRGRYIEATTGIQISVKKIVME